MKTKFYIFYFKYPFLILFIFNIFLNIFFTNVVFAGEPQTTNTEKPLLQDDNSQTQQNTKNIIGFVVFGLLLIIIGIKIFNNIEIVPYAENTNSILVETVQAAAQTSSICTPYGLTTAEKTLSISAEAIQAIAISSSLVLPLAKKAIAILPEFVQKTAEGSSTCADEFSDKFLLDTERICAELLKVALTNFNHPREVGEIYLPDALKLHFSLLSCGFYHLSKSQQFFIENRMLTIFYDFEVDEHLRLRFIAYMKHIVNCNSSGIQLTSDEAKTQWTLFISSYK